MASVAKSNDIVTLDSGWVGPGGEVSEDARRERIMEWVRSLVRLAAEREGMALPNSVGDLSHGDRHRLTQALFKLASAAE